ncbi:MAG: serine/threonine protein kinase [Desulfobacteraceae bacterium]|nr:MAG: serine/threonine protein kinase [Desulfobacteraceae bacterium]
MSKKKKKKWGNWKAVGDIFAEGGQGRLYLVKNMLDNSESIHILKELKNPKRRKRFDREITAITNIDPHPNIIQLLDAGIFRDENKPCYVMPLADCALDKYLGEIVKDINLSFETFKCICSGVEHLHNAGIIHRDLKPQNILIYSGVPKISDFGLCLVENNSRFTPSSEAVGPRFYMAPELEDGKNLDVDLSADIYSLGKILYYILSEGNIFSREKYSEPEYRLSKLFNDPRYDIFSRIFQNSISAHKYQRYKKASEFLQDFNNAIKKFLDHPRTSLLSKLDSIETIKKNTYDSTLLNNLNDEEWKELIDFYRSWRLTPTVEVFELAAKYLPEKHIDSLIFLLMDNENHFDIDELKRISGAIILKNNPEGIHFFMRNDYIERFLILALNNDSEKIADAVARISFLTLRQHDQVILRLSKYFLKLSPVAKKNFVLSSYQTEYEGKLELFDSILEINDLDDISFEAVIAGLCSTKNHSALKRIIAIGDKLEKSSRLEAFARGIVVGARGEAIEILNNHDWKNPVVKILCKAMSTKDDDISSLTE